MMHIALVAVIGFCATAGAVGLAHLLATFLRRPETYYSKRKSDG